MQVLQEETAIVLFPETKQMEHGSHVDYSDFFGWDTFMPKAP